MFDRTPVGNSGYIRAMNAAAIFRLIDQHGPISRKELASNTRYSAATITNHVKALLDAGFVWETSKGDSTGGRKPVHVAVNPYRAYILAVELEVQRVRLLLLDLSRQVVGQSVLAIQPGQRPTQVLSRTVTASSELLAESKLTPQNLLGIGIAAPGQVSADGLLTFAPNLGWKETDLAAPFREAFGRPVLVENEARAGAIGEQQRCHSHIQNLVYVSVKEGIGCGILLGGSLYRGHNSTAGEFGHIPLQPNGLSCHCGGRGCWETLASEAALLRAARRVIPDLQDLDQLYQMTTTDMPELAPIWQEIGHWLGQGMAAVINALGPEEAIIGGGVARFAPFLEESFRQSLQRQMLPTAGKGLRWEFSRQADQATLQGLGALVFQEHIPAAIGES